MLLELKRDGRKKGRLILQGFREPSEWDQGSVTSPVVLPSSLRSFLFSSGPRDECISVNDVSVAFLQSIPFRKDQPPRYVGYKPHRDSKEWLFELLGSTYGSRSASREWFNTFSSWLKDSLGLVPGENEPCLFVHPTSGLKVLLYVDDCIVRATKEVALAFHEALEQRFDCRPESRQFLTPSSPIEFTGVRVTMELGDQVDSYFIDQSDAIAKFLVDSELDKTPMVDNPMPSKHELTRDVSLCDSDLSAWCKSVNGGLHYLVRASRWDIAHPVSRVSQFNKNPTLGMVASLRRIAGYLRSTIDFRVGGERPLSGDRFTVYTDSDHHGDKVISSKSQTGVLVLLNGIPCHWRSNKQPDTADSPACAEIYALKEGVRDARLLAWVNEELGTEVSWPLVIQVDSKQAISFANDTCPRSKIRGSFDLRDDWVKEVRDRSQVSIVGVASESNFADIFTKCLSRGVFLGLRNAILGASLRFLA